MSTLSLGVCIYGTNLNLTVLRGFASLGALALISGADEYDQLSHEAGVQRSAAESHARDALAYALGSTNANPQTDARAFSEVILNARDLSPLKALTRGGAIELAEARAALRLGEPLGLEVDLEKLNEYSGEKNELLQISRVDGNHRLLQARKLLDSGEHQLEEFPVVPFALFLGLTNDQERKIFTDINGNHKNMNRSLMLNFQSKQSTFDPASSVVSLSTWLANQLSESGNVFHQLVNKGGSTRGYRLVYNGVPPITLVGLSNALQEFLSAGAVFRKANEDRPDFLLTVLNDFYGYVRKALPDTFESYKDYIVLKGLGLAAFARLAGTFYSNAMPEPSNYSPAVANELIQVVAEEIDFDRWKWSGFTGKAATRVLHDEMVKKLRERGFGELVRHRVSY